MSLARVSSPRFIGRELELTYLEEAFARARKGTCVPVLIAGEAGVGKTRLVSKFLASAAAAGAHVAVGGATGFGEASLPYAPVVEVLRSVAHSLGSEEFVGLLSPRSKDNLALLIPELVDSTPTEQAPASAGAQASLFAGVLSLFEELAKRAPQVICVEDVHWADRSTQDLIVFLIRNLRHAPVVFVITYRSDEVRQGQHGMGFLVELQRDPSLVRLELSPLDREEVARQIAAILGRPAETDLLDRVYGRSEGNALLVEELLAADVAGTLLPDTLKDALLMRLEQLSSTARAVVGVAAVMGRRVPHELLEVIAGRPSHELDEAVRQSIEQRILVPQPDQTYRFRHALLQEAIYAEILPADRRRLHTLIAEQLAARVPPRGTDRAVVLAQIAHHNDLADDPRATLISSVDAAQAAEASFAFAEAAHHYQRALETWETVPSADRPSGTSLAELMEAAAEARWSGLGDARGAAALLERALELRSPHTDPAARADVMSRRASLEWETEGASARVLDAYEAALEILPSGSDAVKARVLMRYARALLLSARFARAKLLAQDAIAAARTVAARHEELDALITLFTAEGALGESEEAIKLMELAHRLTVELRDPHLLSRFFSNSTYLLHVIGRYDAVHEMAREGVALLQDVGVSRDTQLYVRANAAEALLALGRVAEADELLGHEAPPAPVTAIVLHTQRAYLERTRGDFAAARKHLEQARNTGALVKEVQLQLLIECLTADIAAWQGRLDEGAAAIVAGGLALAEVDEVILSARLSSIAARIAADARGPDNDVDPEDVRNQAVLLLDQTTKILDDVAYPWPEVVALRRQVEAELTRVDGRPDAELWREVAGRWSELARPYESSYARWRQAQALVAAGTVAGVGETIEHARTDAMRIGAVHLIAAIDEVAEALDSSSTRRNMSEGQLAGVGPSSRHAASGAARGRGVPLTLKHEGDFWTVTSETRTVRVKDIRGLHYLGTLLANPRVEFRALDLIVAGARSRGVSGVAVPELGVDSQDGFVVLDDQAKAAYRQRIRDLEADIEAAEEASDIGRAERARAELDFLVAELTAALGLGGRDRVTGSPVERARVSVTKAIRRAVERIAKADPDLAVHLSESVRTGRICIYVPTRDS